jgi:prepilin-type N-terminal cleavage/methylation domain-containing protein
MMLCRQTILNGEEHRHPTPVHRGSGGGFTLIELIVVLVLVGILAATAVPSLATLTSSRAAAGARQVQRDVSFARESAILTGTRTWVIFSASTDTYSILVEDPSNPGRLNASVMTDPATGKDYQVTLGAAGSEFSGVEITSAAFDGQQEIGFDWLGRPLNNAEADLAAQGTVTLSGGHLITVRVGTGMVTYVAP